MNSILTENQLRYAVGPLLYMPALRTDIADKLGNGISGLRSAAVCLEDTVRDDLAEEAENNLSAELAKLRQGIANGLYRNKTPMIFIRVRSPEQLARLAERFAETGLINGFILPKIDDETVADYIPAVKTAQKMCEAPLYVMPIIENPSLLKPSERYARLSRLYDRLMGIQPMVLNVRIGGNDFCRALSLRAYKNQTVYDLAPVASLLEDISAQFTADFTVSAPVWNYFGSMNDESWQAGMLREMEADKAAGFVGKTVIHPSQIELVNRSMEVSAEDYEDARLIRESADSPIQVVKSVRGDRMYEHKVHGKWAEKILALGDIYGIRES